VWDSWSFGCLTAGVLGDGPGRRDRDDDGQATEIAGAGDGGAAVDCSDGRDDGEAESEAVVRGAVAEPLEWLEDAVGFRWADERAGIDHGEVAASRDGAGAGADPDVAAGGVVADRIVDQVRDQVLRQHQVARDDGGLKRGVPSWP
jgi:hypothetical protein